MMTSQGVFPVNVHYLAHTAHGLCAYERPVDKARNVLVYVGGLTSGPHQSPLASLIHRQLASSPASSFALWELRMQSSYTGFGYSSLDKDVDDLEELVKYLRGRGVEKIVLMGHSTGCQDAVRYSQRNGAGDLAIDGIVLLSPTSDREAATMLMPAEALAATIAKASQIIAESSPEDIMPRSMIPPIFNSPISAYRWNSLVTFKGDDDYFSSDLTDADLKESFGVVTSPLLILMGEKDEMVSPTLDKAHLMQRWAASCRPGLASPLSTVISEGDHTMSGELQQQTVAETVLQFLLKL